MRLKFYVIFSVIFCLFYCARQGFPPGGPVDETAPFIVSTIPEQGETHVSVDHKVTIAFSEKVERSSCLSSLFITPYAENAKTRFRGRYLRIIFTQGLKENRTYVITIGAGTRDLRNNEMTDSYTLAFSTGASVDSARIAGRVYGERLSSSIQVWAYDLEERKQINPRQRSPLYVTQIGKKGRYVLSHMRTGHYRLFAVLDRDQNGLYNPELDMLGVGTRDVALDSITPVVAQMNFRISRRDTTPPVLVSGQALDRRHIDLRFSEPMQPNVLKNSNNYIILQHDKRLDLQSAYLDHRNAAYAHLTLKQKLHPVVPCSVQVLGGLDLAGLALDSLANGVDFASTDIADTTAPFLQRMLPPDSTVAAPLDSAVEFFFSESMNQQSVEKNFQMTDSSGRAVKGAFSWKNGAHLLFEPCSELQGLMPYSITLPVDLVYDLSGNPLADSAFFKLFVTLNPDTLTAIAGNISDMKADARGKFYISACNLNGSEYQLILDDNTYRFSSILPGRYRIELFRDADQNRRFSPGNDRPYKPAERYYIYPDTISVRSRWPNEGNDIYFPK